MPTQFATSDHIAVALMHEHDAAGRSAAAAVLPRRPYPVRSLFLVPDGVSLRNFALGAVMAQAAKHGQVAALHAAPDELLPVYQRAVGPANWNRLPRERDDALTFLLRNALNHAHVRWSATVAGRSQQYRRNASWRREAVVRLSRIVGHLSASPNGIRRLRHAHEAAALRRGDVQSYVEQLDALQPSVLFCAKQTSLQALAPVLAARTLGIPTATFIFSWDNLTTKGHIAAPFDHYLVWGEQMRRELLHYYPDVVPDQVHVVGSPQFDAYSRQELIRPRDEFLRAIGASPDRPVICYSGGDAGTCPEDPHHLRILLELVRSGAIKGRPQIVLRPMPVDDPVRYDELRRRYPELVVAAPAWVHTRGHDWASVMPLPEDNSMLVNLVNHSDVNVNVASTMTLDFAVNDRPVVNLAFDVASPPPLGRPIWDLYYQFDHYRPVVELGAARFARSADELATHVNAYLEDPALDRAGRRALVRLQLGDLTRPSSDRIIEVLTQIGGRRPLPRREQLAGAC